MSNLIKKTRRYVDLDGQVYVIREYLSGLAELDDKIHVNWRAARIALSKMAQGLRPL